MIRLALVLLFLQTLPSGTVAQRRVSVTVVTDPLFEEPPQWRGVIRSVFDRAVQDFPDLLGWRLSIDTWRSYDPGSHSTFTPAIRKVANEVAFKNGVLVYFAGRQFEKEDRRGFALLDQRALAVSLDSKRAMALVLRHELGHTLGLPHLPGKNVMAELSTQRTWEFSPLARYALKAVRGMALGNAPLFFGADLPALQSVHQAWTELGCADERILSRLRARIDSTLTKP